MADNDESSDGSIEEELTAPKFVPKSQRMTLMAEEVKKDENRLKSEQQKLFKEIQKTKTRETVASNIRKFSEEHATLKYDSDDGIPDCEDNQLDHALEVSRKKKAF